MELKDPKEFTSYDELIKYAQSVEDWGDLYTEKHHVVPRSEGGTNDKNNLVKLSYRYHIFAHYLRARTARDKDTCGRNWIAVSQMLNCKRSEAEACLADDEYLDMVTESKEHASRVKSERMRGSGSYWYGKTLSKEHKEKIGEAQCGEKHWHYGKSVTEEERARLSAIRRFPQSEETKKKISEATKGKNNPFYGKKHTEEANEKNRQAHLGTKHSDETKQKMSAAHKEWHKYNKHPNLGTQRPQDEIDRIKDTLGDRFAAKFGLIHTPHGVFKTKKDAGDAEGRKAPTITYRLNSTAPQWSEYYYMGVDNASKMC